MCAYDRQPSPTTRSPTGPPNPLIAQDRRRQRNDRYQHPVEFLDQHRSHPPDPVEQTAPAIELADPSPATARATVARFARHRRLPARETDNLVYATQRPSSPR